MTQTNDDEKWILTSVLEFEDRWEGQVFHSGTKEECKKMADLIHAISYSGDEKILSSAFRWFPNNAFGLSTGELWRMPK